MDSKALSACPDSRPETQRDARHHASMQGANRLQEKGTYRKKGGASGILGMYPAGTGEVVKIKELNPYGTRHRKCEGCDASVKRCEAFVKCSSKCCAKSELGSGATHILISLRKVRTLEGRGRWEPGRKPSPDGSGHHPSARVRRDVSVVV